MAETFKPVRGTQAAINRMPITEGQVLFAYDSGHIYLDKNGIRYLMSTATGGSGSSGIIYADGTSEGDTPNIISLHPEDEENVEYTILLSALEDPVLPGLDNLILNSDGRFFRVVSVDAETQTISAILLAVSGTGSSTPVIPIDPDVRINLGDNSYDYMSFIYGQDAYIEFIPEAEKDNYISLRFVITQPNGTQVYEKLFTGVLANQKYSFNMGQVANGENMTMTVIDFS